VPIKQSVGVWSGACGLEGQLAGGVVVAVAVAAVKRATLAATLRQLRHGSSVVIGSSSAKCQLQTILEKMPAMVLGAQPNRLQTQLSCLFTSGSLSSGKWRMASLIHGSRASSLITTQQAGNSLSLTMTIRFASILLTSSVYLMPILCTGSSKMVITKKNQIKNLPMRIAVHRCIAAFSYMRALLVVMCTLPAFRQTTAGQS
jgi:hypothetical protein